VEPLEKSPGLRRFGVGFRIFDVVERRVIKDDKWWSRALEDPSSVYPKTIAAMEAYELSSPIPRTTDRAGWAPTRPF
jgi:hypothetical protein